MLVPPKSAPARVKRVITAANKIRSKPYIYGGGHARWWDRGYDCSGSVSYALHGGNFLESPLPSGPMDQVGPGGEGRWITVYANGGHAYAVIAGYRWDTSGDTAAKPARAGTRNCATTPATSPATRPASSHERQRIPAGTAGDRPVRHPVLTRPAVALCLELLTRSDNVAGCSRAP